MLIPKVGKGERHHGIQRHDDDKHPHVLRVKGVLQEVRYCLRLSKPDDEEDQHRDRQHL